MRPTATLFYSTPTEKMTAAGASAVARATFSPPASVQRSTWHSPVPYLFGGLAAMLGLIAFALLILACSYWKLSGEGGGSDVGQGGEKGEGGSGEKAQPVFEEKFLVIMAGHSKPTFLATPVFKSKSCLVDDGKVDGKGKEKDKLVINEKGEAVKGNGDGADESSQASREGSH